jgi:hypothetical protein
MRATGRTDIDMVTAKEFIIEGVWEDGFFVEYAPVE